MQRHRLSKALFPTSAILVLLVVLGLLGRLALAGPTITVYKSPT